MAIFSVTSYHLPSVSVCAPISSYKDTSPSGWGPTLMATLYLICSFKDLHLKYSHILRGTIAGGVGAGKYLNIWIWGGYNSAHNTPHSSMLPSLRMGNALPAGVAQKVSSTAGAISGHVSSQGDGVWKWHREDLRDGEKPLNPDIPDLYSISNLSILVVWANMFPLCFFVLT